MRGLPLPRDHSHADEPNDKDDEMFDTSPEAMTVAAKNRLTSFIERVERLIEDENAVKSDKKEVYSEAKGEGFDVKIMRKVIKIRASDKAKLAEEDALVDLYLATLGDL